MDKNSAYFVIYAMEDASWEIDSVKESVNAIEDGTKEWTKAKTLCSEMVKKFDELYEYLSSFEEEGSK